MIKMMVTVVIVFTICWLPFNILVILINDERFITWEPLPYFWFAFHWLAMSHSCYNPVIYCYMNARFRGGFLHVLHFIPGIDETSQLHRINTSTTFISSRRKPNLSTTQTPYSCAAETSLIR